MNAKHTPGPWFIWKALAMQREGCEQDEIEDELHHDSEYDIYAGNPDECTRGSLRGHTASICTIEAENFGFYDDEDVSRAIPLANARLIAAAPDLLAALTDLLSYFDSGNSVPVDKATIKANSAEVLAARAAIAKAQGGAA
jgi:hypothetical protein